MLRKDIAPPKKRGAPMVLPGIEEVEGSNLGAKEREAPAMALHV
jgi:hypothetical protein